MVKVVSTQELKERMFFLTRDGDITITEVGYPKDIAGSLFHYANQWLYEYPLTGETDKFGRNATDVMFIRLCGLLLHSERFKSLSVKKNEDGKYIALLTTTVCVNGREMLSELEGELENIITVLEERKENSNG